MLHRYDIARYVEMLPQGIRGTSFDGARVLRIRALARLQYDSFRHAAYIYWITWTAERFNTAFNRYLRYQ